MADSPASTLEIEELTGDMNSLKLQARALPYRPLTIGGKQRVEFTWYPGSPIATSQVLGPEEEPFKMQGFWKERFLGVGEAYASVSGIKVRSVRDLVREVDGFRRRGALCRFTWDSLIREGHITSFTQTWHNGLDCEWELEFSPISQGEKPVDSPKKPYINIADVSEEHELYSDILTNSFGLDPDLDYGTYSPPPFALYDTVFAAIEEIENQVYVLTSAAQNAVSNVTNNVSAGADALNRLNAIADGVKTQAAITFNNVCDVADEVVFPALGVPLPEDMSLTDLLSAAIYKRQIRTPMRDFRDSSCEYQLEYEQVLNPQLLKTFTAPGEMDLRDVSTQFYGTPNDWRTLLLFNRLQSSKLTTGQLIFVPQQGSSSTTIATPGATQ